LKVALFVVFCFRCPEGEPVLTSELRRNSNFRSLSPPPTKAEQEAIAEALSDADALIESLERLIAKKRQIKKGVTQELLTGKKRLPGFSGEWEIQRFGSVLKFQVGFPFSSAFFHEDGQGIRVVKNRDLKSDDQVFHYAGKYSEEFLVTNGDLLIGMDGDFLPCLWKKAIGRGDAIA
jgi:type I restriction enzyme, S subunit